MIVPKFLVRKPYFMVSREPRPFSRVNDDQPRSIWAPPGRGHNNGSFMVVARSLREYVDVFIYCGTCNEWRTLGEEGHTTQGHDFWSHGIRPCIHDDHAACVIVRKIESIMAQAIAPPMAEIVFEEAAHPAPPLPALAVPHHPVL